ncbi:MAG: argininosuccinate lyase, partial [Acidobacteria bacterium]
MKRFALKVKIALALAVIATFVTASAFARAGKQDFTLHNQTGVEIHSLYVSPHSADDWEEDILGKDTLASGESIKITFDDRDKHVHWDLKVTDKDGNALEWYDLNLV